MKPKLRDTPPNLHSSTHDQDLRSAPEYETHKRVLEVWFAGSHSGTPHHYSGSRLDDKWAHAVSAVTIGIGGGLTKDKEQHALSNISLRWMVREILKTGSHILFDEAALGQWGIPVELIRQEAPKPIDPSFGSVQETPAFPGTPEKPTNPDDVRRIPNGDLDLKRAANPPPSTEEASLDALEAAQEIGDQLKKKMFWWVLEVFPTYYVWQNEKDEWVGGWR